MRICKTRWVGALLALGDPASRPLIEMDPIESWVDRDELRRLADSLLAQPASSQPADATYGDDFIGYAGDAPEPVPPPIAPPLRSPASPTTRVGVEQNARSALANARAIVQRGGLLGGSASSSPPGVDPDDEGVPELAAELTEVAPVSTVGLPGEAPVRTPFVARLEAYGIWLREGIQAKSFFVTDREGGILIDDVQSPKLHQVARTLAQASLTANRQAGAAAVGNLHVKIAPETVLEVMPVMTPYGPLILGIIVAHPLSGRNVETVARGLQQALDGGPQAQLP
jgi:hypothetical protein